MSCLRVATWLSYQIAFGLMIGSVIWLISGLLDVGIGTPADLADPLLGAAALLGLGAALLLPAWGLGRITNQLEKQLPKTVIRFTSRDFVERLATVFRSTGHQVERHKPIGGRVAQIYAEKRIWYLFIPGRMVYYVYWLEPDQSLDVAAVRDLNNASRACTDRRYRLPAWLRTAAPMTATVIVSPTGFHYAVGDYVRQTRFNRAGHGNDIYLVDLAREKILHSENLPATGYVGLQRAYQTLVRYFDLARPGRPPG